MLLQFCFFVVSKNSQKSYLALLCVQRRPPRARGSGVEPARRNTHFSQRVVTIVTILIMTIVTITTTIMV